MASFKFLLTTPSTHFMKPRLSASNLSATATSGKTRSLLQRLYCTSSSFHTVDTTKSDYDGDDDDRETYSREYYVKNNGLQLTGPGRTFVTKKTAKGMYVRVDLPGVGKKGIGVWTEKGGVYFEGKGEEGEHEEARNYGGKIICCTDTYGLKHVDATLKDGVLRMMIPPRS